MVYSGLPVGLGLGVGALDGVGEVEFTGGGVGACLEFAQTRQCESYHLQIRECSRVLCPKDNPNSHGNSNYGNKY